MCGAVVLLTLYTEKLRDGRVADALNAFMLCCLKKTRVSFFVKTGWLEPKSHKWYQQTLWYLKSLHAFKPCGLSVVKTIGLENQAALTEYFVMFKIHNVC